MITKQQNKIKTYYEKRMELTLINKNRKKIINLKIQKEKELKEIENQLNLIMDDSFLKQEEIQKYLGTVEEECENLNETSLENLCKNIYFFSSFEKGRDILNSNNIISNNGNSYLIDEDFFNDFKQTIIENIPNGIIELNDENNNEIEENGKFIIFDTIDMGQDYYKEVGVVYIENIIEEGKIEYIVYKASRNSKYGHYIDIRD